MTPDKFCPRSLTCESAKDGVSLGGSKGHVTPSCSPEPLVSTWASPGAASATLYAGGNTEAQSSEGSVAGSEGFSLHPRPPRSLCLGALQAWPRGT